MQIRIVVTGRSYDQAAELPSTLELADEAAVDDALAAVNRLLGGQTLSASCLIAVGQDHVGTVGAHENRALRDGEEVTFIQPVAGG